MVEEYSDEELGEILKSDTPRTLYAIAQYFLNHYWHLERNQFGMGKMGRIQGLIKREKQINVQMAFA